MLTYDPSSAALGAQGIATDRLLQGNARLIRRISQLHGFLEAAGRDNADLRRWLDRARRENGQLRQSTPTRVGERRAQWRDALAEPWSRNP